MHLAHRMVLGGAIQTFQKEWSALALFFHSSYWRLVHVTVVRGISWASYRAAHFAHYFFLSITVLLLWIVFMLSILIYSYCILNRLPKYSFLCFPVRSGYFFKLCLFILDSFGIRPLSLLIIFYKKINTSQLCAVIVAMSLNLNSILYSYII